MCSPSSSSPHTRRYFLEELRQQQQQELFSAHAEVFPCSPRALTCRRPLLRTRGGISKRIRLMNRASFSSPHTRRYFHNLAGKVRQLLLFSAHAEVFPELKIWPISPIALLRTRGGISKYKLFTFDLLHSSPHTRRYFRVNRIIHRLTQLFSAHAEVFPLIVTPSWASYALLRTRGGISAENHPENQATASSPHTRRYFP